MTEPVKSSNGIFYAGMQRVEAEKHPYNAKNIVIRFDSMDENKDGVLSETEILKERDTQATKLKKTGLLTDLGSYALMAGGAIALVAGATVAWPAYLAIGLGIVAKGAGAVQNSVSSKIERETVEYLGQKQENTEEVKQE